MAPQIAHKHHRGHGKLDPGLWGSCYQADIPFVYTIRRDQVDSRSTDRDDAPFLAGIRCAKITSPKNLVFNVSRYSTRVTR